ncbi:signal peptide peptidase SppA [Candidatus Woesearchaeota archaeon]|nr:signal peptide peptidase SppA [Candidatus Woesearchaeota archaeon]
MAKSVVKSKSTLLSSVWDKKSKFVDYFHYLGKILGALVSIFFFLIFVMFFASFFSSTSEFKIPSGNIALVPLNGVITTGTEVASVFDSGGVSSTKVVKLLEKIKETEDIKGVILEINSPGGSPVASAEIGQAIKDLDKPIVAVIRETGASGGYWIASATDKIYAHPMSITGSIGVVASKLAFPGLLKDYNVTYQRLIAGKYKDAGSPYKEMTLEEEKLFQHILDTTYDAFVKEVSENRKIPIEKVKELATGFVYLGVEAKELGLIDELGGRKEAVAYLEKELNITASIAEIKGQPGLFGALGASFKDFGYSIGRGFGDSFVKSGENTQLKVWT